MLLDTLRRDETISIVETIERFMTLTINTSLLKLRNNLGSLVEQAHYTNTQIRLTRHNKPLARIVGERFMKKLDQLLTDDPGLRETLEIMLDRDLPDDLLASRKEAKAGKLVPLRSLLKE